MPKLLLVEDNDASRELLSGRLRRRGYEVVLAVDGEEAIREAKAEMPDLILMDMSLPVLDGWEASRILKRQSDTAHIPIIALIAHGMTGDRDLALASGCDDYDTKPVELMRLLGKIAARLPSADGSRSPT